MTQPPSFHGLKPGFAAIEAARQAPTAHSLPASHAMRCSTHPCADKVHRELFGCQGSATILDSEGEVFDCLISMELRNDNRVQYTLQVQGGG